MFSPAVQKRLISWVLALFSAIAIAGDGLHFLPGLGHGCHESHACHDISLISVGHHEDGLAVSAAENAEDCPVCHFFMQAKTVVLTVDFQIDSQLVAGRIPTIRPLLTDRVVAAYSSRAPPSCQG
jgi:hypothetical protein